MYASEIKDTLTRLRPDFSERSYGCATFGKLMSMLAEKSPKLHVWDGAELADGRPLRQRRAAKPQIGQDQLAAGVHAGAGALQERRLRPRQPLHPQGHHTGRLPDFDEKQIGFKRFSDVMKALEKQKLLVVEMDEAHTMLLKIC